MGYYNNWNVHVTLIFGLNIPFVKLIRLDNYFFAVRGTNLQSLYMNYSGILFAKCDKYKTKSNHRVTPSRQEYKIKNTRM